MHQLHSCFSLLDTNLHLPVRPFREVSDLRLKINKAECKRTQQSINPVWNGLFPSEQANIVRTLVERITVRHGRLLSLLKRREVDWRDDCRLARLLNAARRKVS